MGKGECVRGRVYIVSGQGGSPERVASEGDNRV